MKETIVSIALASALAVAAVAGALAGCCLPLPIYRLGTDRPYTGRHTAALAPECDSLPLRRPGARPRRATDRATRPLVVEGREKCAANDDIQHVSMWTASLMTGVAALWLSMVSAVAYRIARVRR